MNVNLTGSQLAALVCLLQQANNDGRVEDTAHAFRSDLLGAFATLKRAYDDNLSEIIEENL